MPEIIHNYGVATPEEAGTKSIIKRRWVAWAKASNIHENIEYYFPIRNQDGDIVKIKLNNQGQLIVRNQNGDQLKITNVPNQAPPTGKGVVRNQAGTQLEISMVS